MHTVFISTHPFGEIDFTPINILQETGTSFIFNPLKRKLTEDELVSFISDVDILVAGTEPITKKVLDSAKSLKLISRVGIGLDSVDLVECKRRGIAVSYTPDAPSKAVAELTVGLMLNLLRSVNKANQDLKNAKWNRYFGKRLGQCKIGLFGVGRIGHEVSRIVSSFDQPEIFLNDIDNGKQIDTAVENFSWQSKEFLLANADIISLHLPLTRGTKNFIAEKELALIKKSAILINTSRGGIVNERDLYDCMCRGHLNGAALDVFEKEPYSGPLLEIENTILTAHMGSMSYDSRSRMEIEAVEEVRRFCLGERLISMAPDAEYLVQSERLP